MHGNLCIDASVERPRGIARTRFVVGPRLDSTLRIAARRVTRSNPCLEFHPAGVARLVPPFRSGTPLSFLFLSLPRAAGFFGATGVALGARVCTWVHVAHAAMLARFDEQSRRGAERDEKEKGGGRSGRSSWSGFSIFTLDRFGRFLPFADLFN